MAIPCFSPPLFVNSSSSPNSNSAPNSNATPFSNAISLYIVFVHLILAVFIWKFWKSAHNRASPTANVVPAAAAAAPSLMGKVGKFVVDVVRTACVKGLSTILNKRMLEPAVNAYMEPMMKKAYKVVIKKMVSQEATGL